MPRRYFSKAVESRQQPIICRPKRSTLARQHLPVELQHMSQERLKQAYSWQDKDAALPPQDTIDVISRDIAWAHNMFAVLTKRRPVQVQVE